jgi:hypothetical protein
MRSQSAPAGDDYKLLPAMTMPALVARERVSKTAGVEAEPFVPMAVRITRSATEVRCAQSVGRVLHPPLVDSGELLVVVGR